MLSQMWPYSYAMKVKERRKGKRRKGIYCVGVHQEGTAYT